MKLFSAAEIQAVIESLPEAPENQAVFSALVKMRDEQRYKLIPWTYEVDFATTVVQGSGNLFAAPAAAGGVVTGNFVVDAEAPFQLVSSQYQSDVAGAAVTVSARPAPNQAVFISDQSGNQPWMNSAVPVPSIFGTGSLPYFWPGGRLIAALTTVQVTLTNYDAASVPNTRLSFSGYRMFALG